MLTMHKIVWSWAGLGAVFAFTLPIAMWRVSQTPQFIGQSFNSWDCTGKMPGQRTVTTGEMCASLVVPSLPKK
jgi:hypothetical protein